MPRNPKIAEFAAAQTQYNTDISTSIDNVVADVGRLNAKIEELQNTPPVLDPEDQKLLDDIQAEGLALSKRLQALDELTPPEVPTEPTEGSPT